MQDAKSVICQAAKGFVEKIAERREISESRMYEILGKDNPYPKCKVLIRDIAEFNPAGVRLIKADLDSMFEDLLRCDGSLLEVTAVEINKESFDVMDALLQGKCTADQLRELRELQSVVQRKIVAIEREAEERSAA